jgi:hypothetical protein
MSTEPSNPGEIEAIDKAEGPRQFISRLMPIDVQVGQHVIQSLQQPNTVAVLTTVIPDAGGGQNIVSVPLDEPMLDQVRAMLLECDVDEPPRVPCIGFHCFLPPRDAPA